MGIGVNVEIVPLIPIILIALACRKYCLDYAIWMHNTVHREYLNFGTSVSGASASASTRVAIPASIVVVAVLSSGVSVIALATVVVIRVDVVALIV